MAKKRRRAGLAALARAVCTVRMVNQNSASIFEVALLLPTTLYSVYGFKQRHFFLFLKTATVANQAHK